MSVNSFTVTSQDGNIISTSRKITKVVRGCYGCQGECKTHAAAGPFAYHMRHIVSVLSRAKVAQLISQDWLYCNACVHAFHPFICQGNKRKICPCCTTRLALLKTALKRSTVQKIRDTVLISRMD